MVYVAISRDNKRTPIEQAGADRRAAVLDLRRQPRSRARRSRSPRADRGHPVASLRDIPAGEYWMQPFVNVYTRFARADGKTVWLHMDQWEGQNWKRSPGNVYGDPVQVQFDPRVDRADPARRRQGDSADLSRRRTPSSSSASRSRAQILTKWWGHPIYLGATVLLPKDYDKHPDVRYPVNYEQGHFSLRAPGGFGTRRRLRRVLARRDGTPRMIYVTLQHPSPYYDDSYGVNSENNGPYGDAIMQELHPGRRRRSSASSASRGRECSPADRPAAGSPRRTRSSIPTSTAARSPAARTRSTSAITRSSTSTATPTPTSSTRAG